MEKSVFTREYALLRQLLKETRERAGITQVELAESLDETQTYISKVERGERRLDVVQLRQFCESLGTTLPEFIAAYERLVASRRK